jgi:hypothetical protein
LRSATRPQPLALLIRSFIGTPRLEFQYCQQEGCEIQAHFGSDEDKVRRFCKEHKEEGHVDVASKRCEHEGCESRPTYGSKEDGIRRFCLKHKGAHHVNVVDQKKTKKPKKISTFSFWGGETLKPQESNIQLLQIEGHE